MTNCAINESNVMYVFCLFFFLVCFGFYVLQNRSRIFFLFLDWNGTGYFLWEWNETGVKIQPECAVASRQRSGDRTGK